MKCIIGCLVFIIFSGFVSTYVIFPFQTISTNLDARHRLFYNFLHYDETHVVPHPNEDTKFILRSHGVNYVMFCPFGTKFDTQLSICNYEWSLPHWMEKNPVAPKSSTLKDQDKEYQKWLDGCTPFDEMPYFNKSTNSYDCFPTLDVGPCKPKEWFVLDKNNPRYAKCVEQKCACGPVLEDSYDYKDGEDESECQDNIKEQGYNYVDFDGECLESRSTKPCPFGQWLVPDVYGDAKCDCAEHYLHHYNQDGSLTCYQEFLRGPCEEGEQYIPVETEYSFVPKCAPTNCEDKNQIRYNDVCITVPKCGDNQGVKFPSEKHPEATCKNGLGERSDLIGGAKSCPPGKAKDSKGKCRKTIKKKKSANKRSPGTAGAVRNECCNG